MTTQDFATLRAQMLTETKRAIANAVGPDTHIVQALATSDELTVQLNTSTKRLREWHGYVLPEVGHAVVDNELFTRLVATKSYKELKDEYAQGDSMASAPQQEDYGPIRLFAQQLNELYIFKTALLSYLEQLLAKYAPNTQSLAGTTIAARLIASAGSLKRLASLPSSTIQLFGAEKALFRHLKTGARSPKHGHIYNHQLVQRADRKSAGKVARSLADKLALCAKLDYFKGDKDKGKQYLDELQARFYEKK